MVKHFWNQLNDDTRDPLLRDIEHKLNQVYAEVFATIGSGEE